MKPEDSALENSYMHHRLRVKCAKAIVDHSPPLLHIGNYSRFSKMKDDVETYTGRYQQNARLLVALNKVFRTKGEIDTFRTPENSFSPTYSNLPLRNRLLESLDIENFKIGKKLMCARPKLDTWLEDKFKRKISKKKPPPFQYPKQAMDKYSSMEIPSDPLQLQKLFRPKIWFNLEVKGVRPLGRIIIELYTEAAPQVVMEFVRLCFAKQKERINFIRLFPRLWLEGNILLDKKTLVQNNIEYDKRCVDHGHHVGVLSFNRKHVYNPQDSFLNFSLSFKSLNACNGRRVGFGRVSHGCRVLNCIEDFGTKNGKPSREIIVSNCGIFAE